jgi:hypothetical protein
MASKSNDEHRASGMHRRDVLKGLGVAGVAAAGVVAAGGSPDSAEAAETGADAKAGGYRESAHVMRFYELSRF